MEELTHNGPKNNVVGLLVREGRERGQDDHAEKRGKRQKCRQLH